MAETRDFLQIQDASSLEALATQLNDILARIMDRMDRTEGLRGQHKYYSAPDFGANRATNAADATAAQDLTTLSQMQSAVTEALASVDDDYISKVDPVIEGDLPILTDGGELEDSGLTPADLYAFGTVSVSGQSDVVADQGGDALTLVAGTNVTITTDAGADSVTIEAAGDVEGPASSTDNALVRWDGIGGDQLQNSNAILDDDGDLHLYTESAANIMESSSYDTTGSGTFRGRAAGGSYASPSAVAINRILARLTAYGYGATGWSAAARALIKAIATENWTDSAQGAKWVIQITPDGGVITRDEVTIDKTGLNVETTLMIKGDDIQDLFVDIDGDTMSGELEIEVDGGPNFLDLYAYSDNTSNYVSVRGAKTRGTKAAQTAIKTNDMLLSLAGRGHDGTSMSATQARIKAIASSDWTGADHATKWVFLVTPAGSTVLTEVASVDENGLVADDYYRGTQNLDDRYVNDTGDTMTGDLTLDAGILKLYKYGDGVPSEIDAYHALGTKASPSAIDANEHLFKVEVRGHDGTNWSSATRATIRALATEAFTSTQQGTKWQFVVTETGALTTVTGLEVNEDGISAPAGVIGGATNFTEFEISGTMVMHGGATVWEDLRVQISSVRLPASSAPAFDTLTDGVQVLWFDKDSDESVHFTLQMPHSWDGTDIYPHVHWVPKTTSDGTPADQKVRWGLEYSWADIGVVFPSTATVYGSAHTPTDADVVANKHYLTALTTISPSTDQDGISSMLVCRLFRDADSPTDNFENDAGLLEFDLHFRKDTIGSRTETAK